MHLISEVGKLQTLNLDKVLKSVFYHTKKIHTISRSSLRDLKKGTGGRASFNGMVATVFGSTGFLARSVLNKLGKQGAQLILPYRGDTYDIKRLKLVGDLGQVLFQHFNLLDDETIAKCMKYSNVVINLIGRDWETKNYKFKDVHVDGAARIARIAKECGIETFVHISALNAVPKPKSYFLRKGSTWLVSKYDGELAVKDAFPDAIIFRPSDIYGQEDSFLRYYSSLWRHNMKFMPLYKKGETTEKQPVHVSDVAAGIVAACKDRKARGKIFQAVGPRRYFLSDLVDWFHCLTRRTWSSWGYFRNDLRFDPIFKMRISLLPKITLGHPLGNVHWERIEREPHSDQIENNLPTLEDLGICLTCMEDQVPWELRIYKIHSYVEKEPMDFEIVLPPQPISQQ